MGLDIRLPIGLMFSLLGPILIVTGLSNGTVLNSRTGTAMLIFGAIMLSLGVTAQRRLASAAKPAPTPVKKIKAVVRPPAQARGQRSVAH